MLLLYTVPCRIFELFLIYCLERIIAYAKKTESRNLVVQLTAKKKKKKKKKRSRINNRRRCRKLIYLLIRFSFKVFIDSLGDFLPFSCFVGPFVGCFCIYHCFVYDLTDNFPADAFFLKVFNKNQSMMCLICGKNHNHFD